MAISHPPVSLRDRQVLVTGGFGLIGSNLVHRLVQAGAKVTIVDNLAPECGGNEFNLALVRDQVRFIRCDVRDRAVIGAAMPGQELIFCLAAQTGHVASMQDPLNDLAINLESQVLLLEWCRANQAQPRFVYTSTRQLYGPPQYLPVDEKHPINPPDVNGINKLAAEYYYHLYWKIYGIPSTVLRLTNTYGPGMRIRDARQTFVGIWVRRVLEGQPFQIFGTGEQKRDLAFVDDVVDALLLAAGHPAAVGELFNLGAPEAVSLRALADEFVALVPGARYDLVPFPDERKVIDIGDYVADDSKIRRVLGWESRTTLRAGLAATLAFYRQHLHRYTEPS